MSFLEKEFRPFSFRWFMQRPFIMARERRLPDVLNFLKELKYFMFREKYYASYTDKAMPRRNKYGMTKFEEALLKNQAGNYGTTKVHRTNPNRKEDDQKSERAPEAGQGLVSVIIPAYNAEKTIGYSVRSILNQSYTDLEVIVSDDGSRDNTCNIVKELMRSDPRVRLIENKVNRGCYFARNAAVRLSQGKYIAIQDADDISFSRRIEKQLIPLVAGEAEFTLTWILRSRLKINEFDNMDEQAMMQKAIESRQLQPNGKYGYWDRPILGFMTSLFKKSLFEELGLFWEHRYGADAEYFERILFHRTGMIIPMGEENVHTFLRKTGFIPGIFKRIEEILLISAEMNEHNITNTYQKDELNNFIRNYRNKYMGKFDYSYPKLNC